MAYNSNVRIIPGDLVFHGQNAATPPFPFNLLARNVSGESLVSAALVPPTLSAGQYPTIRNSVEFSPNGRYLVYSSGTYGSTSTTGITIWDLDDNTFTTLTSVGSFHRFYFTLDSSTMLVASNTSPFIYSVDLATKTNKGTVTGGPTFANMTVKAAAYGDYLYVISTGTGATGDFYRYNKTTNSLTAMGIAHAFQFSDIVIDQTRGHVFLTNGSTGTGRYINVYDLNNMSTPPGQISTSVFLASTNGAIAPLGFYCCAQSGTNVLKVGKLTYGASVTAITMADISPASSITLDNLTLICNYVYDNVFFCLVTTPPNAYPNYGKHVRTIDFNAYTSGAVVPVINQGPNTDLSAYCIHPGFARRKFAGHVYNSSHVGVARKVYAVERTTNRVVGTTTSSAVDGSFTMYLFTTAQCTVLAEGTGTEVTKLADYVAPVSV